MKTNYRKQTRNPVLRRNTDGVSGRFNDAGHFTPNGVGIHVTDPHEPDRPMSVLLNREDALLVRELIDAFLAQTNERPTVPVDTYPQTPVYGATKVNNPVE